ncbi:MAG: HAD family hydrolase [Dehalococcoidia bacterium]
MKLVCFDLDDTLYPERQFVLSGFGAVAHWVQNQLGMAHFYRELLKAFDEGIRGRTFNIALERLGIACSDELVEALVSVYRLHKPEIQLFADASAALQHLHGRYSLAIITDGILQTQRNKVAALGIEPVFDRIIYTSAYNPPCPKPSAHSYEALMRRFRVEGDDCIYVGDNPMKDFHAPHHLGWHTARVLRTASVRQSSCDENSESDYQEADIKIRSLAELSEVI